MAEYYILIDETDSITYVGKAGVASSKSDAVWQIKKIDESGDPEVIINWADGNIDFDNIWDDRTSLDYS